MVLRVVARTPETTNECW